MKRLMFVAILAVGSLGLDAAEPWESKALNPVALKVVENAQPITLVADGVAKAVLVVPQEKDDVRVPYIKYCAGGNGTMPIPKGGIRAGAFGAEEIQKYVEKTTGAKLPIVTDGAAFSEGLTPIYVGFSAGAKAAGFSWDGLKGEGFRIANNGRAIGIIGAPKGDFGQDDGVGATIFAAYDFLERFVGVRFYYHGEQGVVVHPRQTLVMPAVSYEDHPRYIQRYAYSWCWKDQPDNCALVSALRYRSGGNGWGSEQVYQHSPGRLDLMFQGEDKVECLQLYGRDGKNQRSKTIPPLPCYGNPKTIDYAMEVWERFEKGDKEMRKVLEQCMPGKRALGFSPPDHEVWCLCEHCKKCPLDFTQEYWGWASEVYWDFIQKLAVRVKERWPEKRFYTLPYYNFAEPPKHGEFPDNCYFRLCFMWGHNNYADPFISGETMRWAQGWVKAGHGHKIMGYLYEWPDVQDGLNIPYQYYKGIKKFYTEMLPYVDGFFNCGMSRARPTRLYSDYCEYRLLWNPDFDVEAGLDEFCQDLFGAAAPEMAKVLRTLSDNYTKLDMRSLSATAPKKPYCAPEITVSEGFKFIATPAAMEEVQQAVAAVDRAIASAKGVEKDRLEYLIKPYRILLKRYEFWKKGGQSEGKRLVAEPAFGLKMKIDGALDEPVWENAQSGEFVRSAMVLGATAPDVPTEVKVVRLSSQRPNENGLLVGMKMEEPNLEQAVDRWGDREIYRNNSVEIFFDAGATNGEKSANFIQYVIGSDGRIFSSDGTVIKTGQDVNVKYAVKKGDGFWSLELLVPFDTLLRAVPSADRAKIGTYKAQFCRLRRINTEKGVYSHASRWRTNYQRSNHDVKQFGDVVVWPDPANYGFKHEVKAEPASTDPVMDGKLDDACWQTAPAQPFAKSSIGDKPELPAVGGWFKVVRVTDPEDKRKSGLAFAVHCDEPLMETMKRPKDAKTGIHTGDYVDVRLGIAGAAPSSQRILLSLFSEAGSAKYSKEDNGWNAEFFVPFPALYSWHAPEPEQWDFYPGIRANFLRFRRNTKNGLSEWTRWCANTVRNSDDWNSRGTIFVK